MDYPENRNIIAANMLDFGNLWIYLWIYKFFLAFWNLFCYHKSVPIDCNMEKLLDMMEDDDDVQNVWHNWDNE